LEGLDPEVRVQTDLGSRVASGSSAWYSGRGIAWRVDLLRLYESEYGPPE
jgi:hypothetical protein